MSTDPNFDDFLLDVATSLELSDNDRRLAESRYRELKAHLERPSSPLKDYLVDGESRIYAQGSISIGATIVSGDDDRFDLDAIVEINVPTDWDNDRALDLLYDALQGFPNLREIERCTRCVQMRFATMHLDVTIMDPYAAPRNEREGEIFHSPDQGQSYRVAANPFGFAVWFRGSVEERGDSNGFLKNLSERRIANAIDRLDMRAADQDDLPPILPVRLDSQEVIALKLMKRYLNLRYGNRDLKKPPSVYVSKLAITCGRSQEGLAGQLRALASHIIGQMDRALSENSGPDERNPVFLPDRLNDRWPATQDDRRTLRQDMVELLEVMERARRGTIQEIFSVFGELFGETISRKAALRLRDREAGGSNTSPNRFLKETGTVVSAATATPAIAKVSRPVPEHRFHGGLIRGTKKKGD